jgi:hypothetical protein
MPVEMPDASAVPPRYKASRHEYLSPESPVVIVSLGPRTPFEAFDHFKIPFPTPCVALLKVAAPILADHCALARLLELRLDAHW